MSGILSGILTNFWKFLKYNLIGVDKVQIILSNQQVIDNILQEWKTTKLDGSILDYLGKLVVDKKIDPVIKLLRIMFM